MIDNKKIEEAARYYCNNRYPASKDAPFIAEGFRHGAKWAINEFLKDLWHDVDEMPKRAKAFIFECGDDSMNYHIGMMFNPNDYKKNAETWHMNRWCYLEDILPKKKGDKNE
nr:MAG TPA: hypothetical protein [Caudoviricetes sp.]